MKPAGQLSKREAEVVKLLLQGKSNKLIARSLGISDRTVEFHLKNVYAKLQVSSRIELVLKLGNTPGNTLIENPGLSTVDTPSENTENKDKLDLPMKGATVFRRAASTIRANLEVKNLFTTKNVLAGVASVLFAGFLWGVVLMLFVGASAP